MSMTNTAYRVERWLSDPSAAVVPVDKLRAGDLVSDADGDLHPLVSASPGSGGSMWIQRRDLNYSEHLRGMITVIHRGTMS